MLRLFESPIRILAALVCTLVAGFVARHAHAELTAELVAAIVQTRSAYPKLVEIKPGDRFLASVDDAELASLLARISKGEWDAPTESAVWVVLEGFSRDQGPASTYGRSLTSRVAGSAAVGGNPDALRGTARILERFLEDQSHAYSILAQGLLSEKIRCGAASLGDEELVRRISAEVNPDRELGRSSTDGTVADRYGLHARADLFSIAAIGQRVATVGYFGTVVVSRDGGATWDVPQTGTDEPLYAVSLAGGEEIWAAGRAGVVIRSVDGGGTWMRRATPFDRHIFGLHASGPGKVLAVGDYGLQLRSVDGGGHWSCLPREQDVILGRLSSVGGDAVGAGEFGTIERLPRGIPPGRRGRLSGVPEDLYVFDVWLDADEGVGVAVGLGGSVVRSEDGGATWSSVTTSFGQDLFGVGGSGARVVISGEGGLLAFSEDAGRSFRQTESPIPSVTLTDVEFADAQHVYAVGSRGLVLRSDDGGAHFRVVRTGGGR